MPSDCSRMPGWKSSGSDPLSGRLTWPPRLPGVSLSRPPFQDTAHRGCAGRLRSTSRSAHSISNQQIDLAAAASELGIAVFDAPAEYAQRGRAHAGRDHRADPAPRREGPRHAGRMDESGRGAHEVRGRTLGIIDPEDHRGAALRGRRGARAAGSSSTTPPTSSHSATPGRDLDELLEVSGCRQPARGRPPRRTARSARRRVARCGRPPVPEPVPRLRDRPRRAAP